MPIASGVVSGEAGDWADGLVDATIAVRIQSFYVRPGRRGGERDTLPSSRMLLPELVDEHGASCIRDLHIETLRDKPGTPEDTG